MTGIGARYRGVRVVVLGAGGFIGRWVARDLTWYGAQLCLPVRHPDNARQVFQEYGIRGDIVKADLAVDPGVLGTLFESFRPALVFNLAGYGIDRGERDARLASAVNEQLLTVLCEAMHTTGDSSWAGQAIVHVGSALEYGEIGGDLRETSQPNPTTLYGRTKLAGTRALTAGCERFGLRGVTARLFTVYGPGEHPGRLLPSIMEAARLGADLPLTAGLQQRDFTYVEDVAEGLLRLGLVKELDDGVVNLATGSLHSVREFTEIAAKELAIPAEKLQFGVIPTRAEEMNHDPVAVRRLYRAVAWTPNTGIRDGVRRTAAFLNKKEKNSFGAS